MGADIDPLLKWRGEFPILDRTTYMISNSLGAMPRGVYEGLRGYADSWSDRGVRAWEEGWWEMAVGVGDQIAPLIGAGPGEISLHQNVTLTQAVISSCFDFRGPRNKVAMVELEFPSIQYFYHEQRRLGARVELLPTPNHMCIDLDKLLAAIDETTLLVPISQVLFRSSSIVDARAIVERAHRVGAHVILDLFQAAGTIPLDVRSLGVDFAVGGVLKWLCGGPGVAYLYVREDLRAKLLVGAFEAVIEQTFVDQPNELGAEIGVIDRTFDEGLRLPLDDRQRSTQQLAQHIVDSGITHRDVVFEDVQRTGNWIGTCFVSRTEKHAAIRPQGKSTVG